MTNLARALIAILALCEVMGCRRSTNRSVPRDLEAKREEYEAIVAHDPDNYRANSSLSTPYTTLCIETSRRIRQRRSNSETRPS
jgi:hypothetical protein